MNKNIMLQLYVRESGKQQLVEIGDIDASVELNDAYLMWRESKRSLVNSDVVNTTWLKTCTGGYITEVHFDAGGSLTEFRLFDRFETTGSWELQNGVLKVSIVKGDNQYRFNVVGNADLNIHSAIEYKNDELHSYLKLAQVKA